MEDILEAELKELTMDELARKMSNKHLAFCEHYMTDSYLNVQDAYIKVYGNVKRSTARINGNRLLSNTLVRAYIGKMQQQMRETQKVTREFLIDKTIENLVYGMNGRQEFTYDAIKQQLVPTGNVIKDQRAINDSIRLLTELTGLNKEVLTDSGLENELKGATEFVVSVRKQRQAPQLTDDGEEDGE